MSKLGRLVLGLSCLLASASAASGQEPLVLDIRDGQVTVRAQNIPLRVILNEWARIGGTNVVGADRIGGAPVTLELSGVPERQALDVLLRNASGYVLGMRPSGVAGASAYNRILIMPPSTAPRPLPNPTVAAGPRLPVAVEEPEEQDLELDAPGLRPGGPVRMPTVVGQSVPPGGGPTPTPLPIPETDGPTSPGTPGVVIITPSNPFGVPPGSSTNPGVISPVPQAPPQREPDPD